MAAKLRERDGFYWVVVHVNGRRKWKKIGRDRRQAQAVVNATNRDIALGKYQIAAPTRERTVGEALSEWHADYLPTFSASFAETALHNIENHLEPAFGALRLSELAEKHLLQFIAAKSPEGAKKRLKASTLLAILSVLRRVMALCVENEELNRNPCRNLGKLLAKVKRQQSDEVRRIDAWSREEVAKLLEVARRAEPGFYPLLVFLLSTGCRKGEALGLKWEDADLDGARLLIRRALVRGRLGTPKSGQARTVVLSPLLGGTLRDLLSRRRRETLAHGWPEIPELVFCSETGGPLDERNVTRSWYRVRRLAKAKGVRPLRLHDARHTFASHALAAGKSVRWVASQLGHARPELTLRVYAHAMREEEVDLSFLDFAGGARRHRDAAGRHPRGTERMAATGTRKPLRATPRKGYRMLEHETGLEPATPTLATWRSTS